MKPNLDFCARQLSIRSLLLCTAAVLSYCFVITGLLFHYYANYQRPCGSRSIDQGCNRSSTWILNVTDYYTTGVWATSSDSRNDTSAVTPSPLDVVLVAYGKSSATLNSSLALCPVPSILNLSQPFEKVAPVSVNEHDILQSHRDLSLGGQWKPAHCTPRHKVAIIVPYRDRMSHLRSLLNYLIPMLKNQQTDFRFIISEQVGNGLFNKGRVMNAAFQVAEKMDVHCVIFHDVDMFPENPWTPYICPDQPRHLGAYVNVLKYSLWYHYLLGGVIAIGMDHYRKVNGHSNEFWGYGGEDDDFGKRVLANNMTIERLSVPFSKYTMLRHSKRKYAVKDNVYKLLNDTESRWPYDGLNDTKWTISSLIAKPLYYHLHVDVGEPPKEWAKKT